MCGNGVWRSGYHMGKLLIIEDEPGLCDFLQIELCLQGNQVDVAQTGEDGIRLALSRPYDAILLDLMLPDIPGIEVCQSIRKACPAPILILTARGAVTDRVALLDAGADDYLVKPFAIEELMARLRVQLRHQTTTAVTGMDGTDAAVSNSDAKGELSIVIGSLVIYPERRQVVYGEDVIDVTAREYELLLFFVRHPDVVFSRQALLEAVWGFHSPVDTNVVDVYIGYLRQKVDKLKQHIQTVRGAGYVFRMNDA